MNIASVSGIPKIGGGVCKKRFFLLEEIFLITEKFCPAVQN